MPSVFLKCEIKHLKPSLINDGIMTGAVYLALEVNLLTYLSHEKIIKIYGVAGEYYIKGNIGGYFLVLEKLQDTLIQKFN